MRVTSSLWVGAYVRRCLGHGISTVVARHGADEAGAIFVRVDRLDGTADLYAPAPQATFAEARPDDRRFQRVAEGEPSARIDERLTREIRFDPDLWIVVLEDREGRNLLEDVSLR
jgi:hypothetical protein